MYCKTEGSTHRFSKRCVEFSRGGQRLVHEFVAVSRFPGQLQAQKWKYMISHWNVAESCEFLLQYKFREMKKKYHKITRNTEVRYFIVNRKKHKIHSIFIISLGHNMPLMRYILYIYYTWWTYTRTPSHYLLFHSAYGILGRSEGR